MISRVFPVISVAIATRILIAFLIAAIGAYFATPKLSSIENAPNLENTVPRAFGDWVELKSPLLQVSLSTGGETDLNQPYDQVVMRTYRNSAGRVVQLALAWGGNQRQEVKIHRPDLCYVAQGYQINDIKSVEFNDIGVSGIPIKGKQMIASANRNIEAVTYWIRIGNSFSEDAFETRVNIFREGLAGNIPDGILVRVSMPIETTLAADEVWGVMNIFLKQLIKAAPNDVLRLMLGNSPVIQAP